MKQVKWTVGVPMSEQLQREKIRLGLMKKPEGYAELKGEDKQYTPKRKAQNSTSLLIRSRRRER